MKRDATGQIDYKGKIVMGQAYKPPPELQSEIVEALCSVENPVRGTRNVKRVTSGTDGLRYALRLTRYAKRLLFDRAEALKKQQAEREQKTPQPPPS